MEKERKVEEKLQGEGKKIIIHDGPGEGVFGELGEIEAGNFEMTHGRNKYEKQEARGRRRM